MPKHRVLLSALLAMLLTLSVGMPVMAQEDPADIATARDLFREGLQLSKEKKWEEAREKLGESLALKQAALTYYTLAIADRETGHLVAALEHFRGFLAQPVTSKTEAFVDPAKDAVQELKKRVSGLTITIKPAGVLGLSVRLDGEEIPLAALGRRRLVDPGEHVVTAKADGYLARTQKITTSEGEYPEVLVTLERAQDQEEPPPSEAEFPILPVALIGGGVVVGAVGLALGIVGVQEAKDAPTSDGEEADKALTKTIAGDVLMGVGGAVAAVGVVLLIVHFVSEDAETTESSAVRPWASGDVVGVELRF